MMEYDSPRARPINLNEVLSLREISVRDGISLRLLESSDADQILGLLDSEANSGVRDRVMIAYLMHTPEDVAAQVEVYKNDDHLLRYVIVEEGDAIGMVSFWRDIDNPLGDADHPDDYGFGYFIDHAKRGKGIVPDAVRSVMEAAAEELYVENFVAFCADDNVESKAVLTKLGFHQTDTEVVGPTTGWVECKFVYPIQPTNG